MADENILAAAPSAVRESSPIHRRSAPEATVVEDLGRRADALWRLSRRFAGPPRGISPPGSQSKKRPSSRRAEPVDKEVEYPPLPTIDEPIAETVEVATAAVERFVEPQSTVAEPSEIPAVEPEPGAPNQRRTRRLRVGESASNRSPPAPGRTSFARRRADRRPAATTGATARACSTGEPKRVARVAAARRAVRTASSNSSAGSAAPTSRRRCARRRCPRSRRSCQRPLARCLNPSIRLRS